MMPLSMLYRVTQSKSTKYSVGDLVVGNFGWRTCTLIAEAKAEVSVRKLDSSLPFSPSTALGILGMPG